MNDLTKCLSGLDDREIDKLEESVDNQKIAYKDKLAETSLMPITKRIDRNLIVITAEALSNRLRFSGIGLKEERAGRRSKPVGIVLFKKRIEPYKTPSRRVKKELEKSKIYF